MPSVENESINQDEFGCLSAAEKELIRAKQKNAKVAKRNRIRNAGKSTVSPTCPKDHRLQYYLRDVPGSNSCDRCGRQEIVHPEHVFRCEPCDFDLCQRCYSNKERDTTGNSIKRDYLTRISEEEYFAACPSRLFHDRWMQANAESLATVMRLVDNNAVIGDRRGRVTFADYQYFVFAGTETAIWDPTFYARLAYEGFFVVTMDDGPHRCEREPLPELQPFYSVVDWDSFNESRSVKKFLKKCRRTPSADDAPCSSTINYHMYVNSDVDGTYRKLDAYHKKRHGCNWMTPKYLETLKLASADPNINFKLYTIELYDGPLASNAGPPSMIAGEIGYTIGQIYTSLSGFYEVAGCGTVQLALLGKWLEHKNCAFWSLGHCYSPEMEYKRQLGHRVYPRLDFLQRLRASRGTFMLREADAPTLPLFSDGEECNICNILHKVQTWKMSL